MKEEVNKRKIRIFLTLEGKYIQKKDEIKKDTYRKRKIWA